MTPAGFFIDWDGNTRRTESPGKGYRCEVDAKARYVGIFGKYGTLDHEGTYYKTLADIEAAGIKVRLLPDPEQKDTEKNG